LSYDSLDEQDSCPVYYTRASLYPIEFLGETVMKCDGKGMPPTSITFNNSNSIFEKEYEVSSEFIESAMEGNSASHFTYDVELTMEKMDKQYYFDIETRFDFVVSDISLSLYATSPQSDDDKLIKIAESVGV
jgi:hypothetical protein